MTEFAPDGEVVWDATFPSTGQNTNSYRSFKAPWSGKPKDRPAIASEADGGGAKVYASWNGSTEVQSWKVYTGANAGSLTEVGSSTWKGLETMIPIPTVDTNVQGRRPRRRGQRDRPVRSDPARTSSRASRSTGA